MIMNEKQNAFYKNKMLERNGHKCLLSLLCCMCGGRCFVIATRKCEKIQQEQQNIFFIQKKCGGVLQFENRVHHLPFQKNHLSPCMRVYVLLVQAIDVTKHFNRTIISRTSILIIILIHLKLVTQEVKKYSVEWCRKTDRSGQKRC